MWNIGNKSTYLTGLLVCEVSGSSMSSINVSSDYYSKGVDAEGGFQPNILWVELQIQRIQTMYLCKVIGNLSMSLQQMPSTVLLVSGT